MMPKNLIYILIVYLVVSAGCSSPYTIKDNGRTVELQMDSPFEVELEGNPSTGYSWQVAEVDTNVIKQIGEPIYESSGNLAGSGGTYTFRFRTVDNGETPLVLVYGRPFEPAKAPVKTFRLKIISGTMGRITGE